MTTAAHLQHFGLTRPPFQIRPDTDFFFPGNRQGEYLDALLHVAAHDEGLCIVIAGAGGGKTLMARQMIARLPGDIQALYLAYPCLGRGEILDAIGSELGMDSLPDTMDGKLAMLQGQLRQRHADGKRILLVIDEAHTLPTESLEEIRMLSDLEAEQHKLVNILLLGQPGLDTLLTDPRLRQVQDRVIHRFELTPFSRDDVAAYIDHRLRASGWQGGPLFDDKALDAISHASEGRAQRINLLADLSLQAACAKDAKQVHASHVKQAMASLPDAPALPREQSTLKLPTLPRLRLAGSLAALALAGTVAWALTFTGTASKQAAPASPPHAQAKPQTKAGGNAASPAEPAATQLAENTHTPPPGPSPADTPASAAQATVAPVRPEPASPAPAPVAAAPTAKLPAQSAPSTPSAPTSAKTTPTATTAPAQANGASGKPSPKLKLDTELASVQRVIPFAVYSASLGPRGRKAIAEIVPLAKQAERINVRGRTDSSGDREQNREIAKARAISVIYAFKAEGVSRKIMKATYCTRCFVATNDTAEGRRANRRVDVELVMPAKLALHLPKPVYSAPDVDNGPVLLARLDDRFMEFGHR